MAKAELKDGQAMVKHQYNEETGILTLTVDTRYKGAKTVNKESGKENKTTTVATSHGKQMIDATTFFSFNLNRY